MLVSDYQKRYDKELIEAGIRQEWHSERQFMVLLTYLLNKLYAGIVKIESDEAKIRRKKGVITLIEDLVQLSHIFMLERHHKWEVFHL